MQSGSRSLAPIHTSILTTRYKNAHMPLQLPAMLPPIMSIGHQTNTLGAKPPMYKLAVGVEAVGGGGEPMELRHSDVGRTGRQSNKGTVGDTASFLVPHRQRCHEVKERRRDEPARLRYVWVWKCRECVVAFASFVTDATWGCYRALYIVSVSSLHMKYTMRKHRKLLSFTGARHPTPLHSRERNHINHSPRVRLSSFLALPDQIITRSTTFHHLGCIRGR